MPVLTAAAVARVKPADTRREIADGTVPGLFLVHQPSGVKSWALRYRIGGRTRKLTIGPVLVARQTEAGEVPAIGQPMTLGEARRAARQALQEIAEGSDPAKAKKADRRAALSGRDRVDALVSQYVDLYCKPRLRQWKEIDRLLRVEVVSRWGARRVTDIRRRDVIDLLDGIVARGAPVTANRVLSTLSRFFGWLVERDVLKASPVLGLRKPSPEVTRDRVLTDDEIAAVWSVTSKASQFNWIVRLLLLTGERRTEVAAMSWSELDLDARAWTIPPSRSKNGRAHVVPLSEPVVEVLAAIPRVAGQEFVFGKTGRTPFSGHSMSKAILDNRLGHSIRLPWVLHDLRRTAASGMASLGVNLPVIEKVLNHVGGEFGGVRGIYQRYSFDDEKCDALDRWARHVMRIAASDAAGNVVALRGRPA